MKKTGLMVGVGVVLATTGMASASAVYTPIVDTAGEPNHLQILQGIYSGGSVVASGTNDYTVTIGAISFQVTRIADSFLDGSGNPDQGAALQLGTPNLATMSDQIWQDGLVDTRGEARFAGFSQAFGTGDDVADMTINASWAFDVNGTGFNVTGGTQLSLGSDPFAWVRGDQASGDMFGGNLQSSLEGDNPGSDDEMVSYVINDADYNGGRPSYLLFFEDSGAGPDRDFNDLVIEVSVIPLPPAALMGLAGLVGAGVLRRRRFASE